MNKADLLWDKFMTSGKIEDYINFCKAQRGKEKTDESEHRGLDNQRKEYR